MSSTDIYKELIREQKRTISLLTTKVFTLEKINKNLVDALNNATKLLELTIDIAINLTCEPQTLGKTEGSNEILSPGYFGGGKGVQKKEVVNEEEERLSRQPTADLPPLVEQEDEEENYNCPS